MLHSPPPLLGVPFHPGVRFDPRPAAVRGGGVCFMNMLIIIVIRNHYTVDVLCSFYVTCTVWQLLPMGRPPFLQVAWYVARAPAADRKPGKRFFFLSCSAIVVSLSFYVDQAACQTGGVGRRGINQSATVAICPEFFWRTFSVGEG